jgi:hypothetical protein
LCESEEKLLALESAIFIRGEYGGAAASLELSSLLINVEDARPELPEPLAILSGEYRLRREVDFFVFFFVREETSFSREWVDDRKKFTTRCGILPT